MSRPPRNPTNWDEYQYGTSFRRSSGSSYGGRSVQFDNSERGNRGSIASSFLGGTDEGRHDGDADRDLRPRGSSVALRLNALAQVGGANSIANFARSWQRAAGFHEVAPGKPSFILTSGDNAQEDDG